MKNNVYLKHDNSITILRVIGMFMIIFCHIFKELKIYSLGEVFITGVHLFLFVSGYLAALNDFSDVKKWLIKKAKKILTPYYIYVIILFSIYSITKIEKVSLFHWIFCLLNLQGLNYTYWGFEAYGAVEGVGHLWFVTTIMICYLLTPLFKKITRLDVFSKKLPFVIVSILFITLGLMYCRLQLSYIMIYFFGYLASFKKDIYKEKYYFFISLGLIICTVLRFVFRNIVDGSNFYDRYYVHISSLAVVAWIFYTMQLLNKKLPRFFEKITKSLPIVYLEKWSYYVYIVHYLFLSGNLAISNFIDNVILSNLIAIICAIVTGGFLCVFTEQIFFKIFMKGNVQK